MKIKQIYQISNHHPVMLFITPCWQYFNGHVPVTHDQLLMVLGPSKMEHSHSLLICSSLSTTQILLFFGTHIGNQWTRRNLILDHWRSRLQPFNGSFQYGTHTNQRCVTCKHAGEINTPLNPKWSMLHTSEKVAQVFSVSPVDPLLMWLTSCF